MSDDLDKDRYITLGGWPVFGSKLDRIKALCLRPSFMLAAAISIPVIANDLAHGFNEKAAAHTTSALIKFSIIEFILAAPIYIIRKSCNFTNECIDKRGNGASILGTALPNSQSIGDVAKNFFWIAGAPIIFSQAIHSPKLISKLLYDTNNVSSAELGGVIFVFGFAAMDIDSFMRFHKVSTGEYAIIGKPPGHKKKQEDTVPGALPELK
jgi:hypothetical protein